MKPNYFLKMQLGIFSPSIMLKAGKCVQKGIPRSLCIYLCIAKRLAEKDAYSQFSSDISATVWCRRSKVFLE